MALNWPARNLSTTDRVIRGIVGIVCIYIGVFEGDVIGEPIVQGILILFGVINVFSFFTRWCIVYTAAGLSTYKR